MNDVVTLLLVAGGLLAMVTLVQILASRLTLPESTLLVLTGIDIDGAYMVLRGGAPALTTTFFAPLVDSSWPAEVYLWLFLSPLLFQTVLSMGIRSMAPDAAPIPMLAIVAVVVTTSAIGLAVTVVTPSGIATRLLPDAMIATTSLSTVITVSRDVGASARLIRLVGGEVLLDDAAATTIMGVLLIMLTGHGGDVPIDAGLCELAKGFSSGMVFGLTTGRIAALLLLALHGVVQTKATRTLALPYPLYLVVEDMLGVLGAVSAIYAGLMIDVLDHTHLTPRN